jgi:hypothetical protein
MPHVIVISRITESCTKHCRHNSTLKWINYQSPNEADFTKTLTPMVHGGDRVTDA